MTDTVFHVPDEVPESTRERLWELHTRHACTHVYLGRAESERPAGVASGVRGHVIRFHRSIATIESRELSLAEAAARLADTAERALEHAPPD